MLESESRNIAGTGLSLENLPIPKECEESFSAKEVSKCKPSRQGPKAFGLAQWLVVAVVFAASVGPTFISYRPYIFLWDDADYLSQSIAVSRAFWSGQSHGAAQLREVRSAMVGIRPPAMTLLGLPWGRPTGSDIAGKSFVTLGSAIGIWAAFCFFLLTRIGTKPLWIVIASVCVGASLGPWPPDNYANHLASGFMADSLFAWTVLASLLLIPHEARAENGSILHAGVRGMLWGLVLSAGSMTKISFLYFDALILPALLFIRYRRTGLVSVLVALAGFSVVSTPALAYLLKYGRASFENGGAASFGAVAGSYRSALAQYFGGVLQTSPGLWCFVLLLAAALTLLLFNLRSFGLSPGFFSMVVVAGFGIIVLASPNHLLRFLFPVIISTPFLVAVTASGRRSPVPLRSATIVACATGVAFTAAALPTQHRPELRQSFARANSVLAYASQCGDHEILIATDSSTLNLEQLRVAVELSRQSMPAPVNVNALTWSPIHGTPMQADYRVIDASDIVVFQNDEALNSPSTNMRVSDYRRYIAQQRQFTPTKIWDDVSAFSKPCK